METKTIKMGPLDVIVVEGDPGGAGIVLFHGFGADARDLAFLSTIVNTNPRPTWFFPNGPLEVVLGPGFIGRAWFPIDTALIHRAQVEGNPALLDNAFPKELSTARQLCVDFLHEISIPFSKLFLGGFSQGAILAADIALHAMENPAGLILFSGALVNKENWEKFVPLRKGVPFFQSHGKDDPLLPLRRAKALEELFVKGGLKGRLLQFNGGHEIPREVLTAFNGFLTERLSH